MRCVDIRDIIIFRFWIVMVFWGLLVGLGK